MILAHVVQVAAFKKCCMRTGRYDGSLRNHFFPRIEKQFSGVLETAMGAKRNGRAQGCNLSGICFISVFTRDNGNPASGTLAGAVETTALPGTIAQRPVMGSRFP
jgi:hypothetical protein